MKSFWCDLNRTKTLELCSAMFRPSTLQRLKIQSMKRVCLVSFFFTWISSGIEQFIVSCVAVFKLIQWLYFCVCVFFLPCTLSTWVYLWTRCYNKSLCLKLWLTAVLWHLNLFIIYLDMDHLAFNWQRKSGWTALMMWRCVYMNQFWL